MHCIAGAIFLMSVTIQEYKMTINISISSQIKTTKRQKYRANVSYYYHSMLASRKLGETHLSYPDGDGLLFNSLDGTYNPRWRLPIFCCSA